MPSSNKKLVSVIIPTYNRADYIVEAIESVLSQKIKGWSTEVIVVDDGSTDNTKQVLKQFSNKIKYIEIPHSGKPAVARNAGLAVAKGELIALQDSDDKWTDNKLAIQVPTFDDPDIVMSYGNAQFMTNEGVVSKNKVIQKEKLKRGETFKDLLEENCISTLTVMFRRSILEELTGFDESDELRAVKDYQLWLRVAALFPKKIKSIDKTLAYYRRHDQNISSADNTLALTRLNTVYQSLWPTELSEKQRQILEKRIETCNISLSYAKNDEHPEEVPVISVVMSVYNGGKFLHKSIESILNQTVKNIEFIIIDDGSNDDSAATIKGFNDRRIRYIPQQNHGLVFALNRGFKIASSDLVARMDADDISAPSRLERQLSVVNTNPTIALVGTFSSYLDEQGKFSGITIAMPTKDIDIKRALSIVNPFAHGSMLIRRQAWEDAGGYTDKYGPTEDYKLWCDIVKLNKWDTSIVPEALYWYRINPESISQTNATSQHTFAKKIAEEYWQDSFRDKSLRALVRDGNAYKKNISEIGLLIFDAYKQQQLLIMKKLFSSKYFVKSTKTFVAICIFNPRWAVRFVIPSLLKSTIRKGRL